MPKQTTAAVQLPEEHNWLRPVLAAADARDAIEQGGSDIADGVTQDAATTDHEPANTSYAYSGHTDGSNAIISMQRTVLESEIDNINEEIRITTDEAAYLVRIIEASRDDKLGRLIAKRDNALKSAEALQAMQKVLGR